MSTRIVIFFTGMLLVLFGAAPEQFFRTGKAFAIQQVSGPITRRGPVHF